MENSGQTNWGTISAVAFLTTAIGSIFMIGGALESQRPNQQGAMVPAGGNEVVSVRLWQDPLEAIYSHWGRILAHAESKKRLPQGITLPNTIKSWSKNRKSPELHLFVMAPGTPYAEDVENRRRQRYAVVTALAELDYIPTSADRIGYFVAPDFAHPDGVDNQRDSSGCVPVLQDSAENPSLPSTLASGCMIVGFEEFKPPSKTGTNDHDTWQSIVVFWLNSEDFKSDGLDRIAALMAALSDDVLPASPKQPTNADRTHRTTSVLLGPNNSEILKNFMDQADDEAIQRAAATAHFLERTKSFPASLNVLYAKGETDIPQTRITRNDFHKSLPQIEDQAKFDECLKDIQPKDIQGIARCLESHTVSEFWNGPNWATRLAEKWVSAQTARREQSQIQKNIDDHRSKLHVLSTLATVPLDILFDNPAYRIKNVEHGPAVEARLASDLRVASFASLVARDDLVLVEILHELSARGACRKDRPILAIVSEQDTVYGRQLDDIVVERLRNGMSEGLCDFEVKEFGYLAGVDGEALPDSAGQDESSNDDAKAEASTDGKESEAFMGISFGRDSHRERAAGDAQLDYIRRLADLINQADSDGSSRFAAIGVLGTDVYDKQLILQALRERLPSSTFFTTDLDARLTDPGVNRWTRNLIVGSAYGLSAQHQKGAGFRDTYQTALYRAVRLSHQLPAREATPYLKQTCANLGDPYLCAPSPKIFEIGRTGAVDITNCREFCKSAQLINGEVGHIRLDPDLRTRLKASWGVFVPLTLLTLVSCLLFWKLDSKNHEFRQNAHLRVLAVGSISLLWLGAGTLWWTQPGYEPWAFFEGVSTVPTLVLETTTIIFSVAMVMIMLGRAKQGDHDAAVEFNLPKKPVQQPTPTWFDWIRPRILLGERVPHDLTPVHAIWETHLKDGVWPVRLSRILAKAIFSAGIAILILEMTPEPLLSRHLHLEATLIRGAMIVAALTAVIFWSDTLKLERALLRDLAWGGVEGFEVRPGTSEFDRQVFQIRRVMDLIVWRTEVAGPIVVLPFILLPFLMLARSPVFEGWVWTWPILALHAAFGVYILVNAFLFQTEAARARDQICERLKRHRFHVKKNKHKLRQISMIIDDIYGIRQGAFVRWTSHPILQSLALVVGGFGLIALLNFLF